MSIEGYGLPIKVRRGMVHKLYLFLTCFFWGQCLIWSQETPQHIRVIHDIIPIPAKRGKPLVLEASPMQSSEVNSFQLKPWHWIYLDYENKLNKSRIYTMTANIYVYPLRGVPMQEYKFFVLQKGEEISLEEYRGIKFIKMNKALSRIQDKANRWSHRERSSKELWEVSAWQHPNLYIVSYNKEHKKYYRYRVVMVVYCDKSHPNAFSTEE